ncbi:MAG: PfkB family carbohydrate kinase [Spirochaetes bacterium]|nr:PfkB family carbohydrate kinase [Spirochaetota bacterium]
MNDMIEKLFSIAGSFPEKRILVIGDIMVDEYIWGSVSRVSPEAPVPVVQEKKREIRPGGAFNVVNNLVALSTRPLVAGAIGNDECGSFILEYLRRNGIDAGGIVEFQDRPTTKKTRIVGNNQQIVRLDLESTKQIEESATEKIIKYIDNNAGIISGIIISDYNKGVINKKIQEKVKMIQRLGIFVAVDPQIKHYRMYNDLSLITPNHHEAGSFVGTLIDDDRSLHETAGKIMDDINPELLLITLGERGMMLYGRDRKFTHVPTIARHVYDVSGAGDTVICVFTLAMICGAKPVEAAVLSNIAAGYVVGEVGTAVIPHSILMDRIRPEYIPI